MINKNNNYENTYIYTLLQINKSLRNEIEIIYKLLRQKIKLELPPQEDNNKEQESEYQKKASKLSSLINEFEIVLSNLGIQMESHNQLITTMSSIEEKYKVIQKNTILMNDINEYQKKIKALNIQNNEYKLKYETLFKDIETTKNNFNNLKKTNDFLNKENVELRIQVERFLKEKKDMLSIISQVEVMSNRLKDVEKHYNDKLEQKDKIISNLDAQLQKYEIEIKKYKLILKQNKYINDINGISNDNNSTSLNSDLNHKNIKIINQKLNNSNMNLSQSIKNKDTNYNIDNIIKNDKDIKDEKKIIENLLNYSEQNNEENEDEEENIDELLKEVDEEVNKSI